MAVQLSSDSQQILSVSDSSHVGEARRGAGRLASEAVLDETDAGKVAIIVTELATNLLKHAERGEILIRGIARGGKRGVECIALDRGPGIANLSECFRDGYSTTGSSGTGLGSAARLASDFDVHSLPGKGTAVFARVWRRSGEESRDRPLDFGAVSVPKAGEEICGDAWTCVRLADKSLCMVADGLGHGANAAIAARRALEVLAEHRNKPLTEIVAQAHQALRTTRGAALALAELDHVQDCVRFCGVGNIAGAIIAGDAKRQLVSLNGTAGIEARKISEFSYPWRDESTLIMHSDGLTGRWDLGAYPGLTRRDPNLIAAVLYRDFSRNRDDATVLVAKRGPAGGNRPWRMS